MTFRRARCLALLLTVLPAPALAQGMYPPGAPSDVDALADTMRRLGANPRDLEALLTAGELSVRLEDLSAAGSFFARAEKIDPRSPRVKAGEGAILVRSQRPAEALRYFAQAEAFGLPLARLASDRGLAYDLLGDNGRAQRDYRLALAMRPEPETRRRFALSLAIVGRQSQALDELAPLIAQNDRAAWRTRAFVLAMGGDAAEAARIAQTMMPPGAAAGLRSFFADLSRLSPVDRAFAVHFGEVRPSAVRLADARLAPREAPLPLEPLPVRVAAVAPQQQGRKNKRDRRRRDDRQPVQVAAVVPAPQPPGYAAPAYQPPAYQPPAFAPRAVATTPVRDRPLSAGEQASLARAGLRNVPRAGSAPSAVTVPGARALTPAEQASLAAATIRPNARRGTSTVVVAPVQPPVQLAATLPTRAPSFPATAARPLPNAPSVVATTGAGPAPVLAPAPPIAASVVAPLPSNTVPAAAALTTAGPPLAALGEAVPPIATPSTAGLQPPSGAAPVSAPPMAAAPSPGALAAAIPVAGPLLGAPAAVVPPATTPSPVVPEPGFSLAQVDITPSGRAADPARGAGQPMTVAPALSIAAADDTSPAPLAGGATPAGAVGDATPGAVAPTVLAAAAPPAVALPGPADGPALSPVVAAATASVRPTAVPAAASVVSSPPPRRRLARGEGDSILAKIVANLTIPASELEVGAPAPRPGRLARVTPVEKSELTPAEKKAAEKKEADKKLLADKKAAADKKLLAEKKAAADKKALADKEAAEEKKLARAEPQRFWVQVAGGANESDLAKAWRAAQAKAPVLAGKSGWTTPLRATNRVLSGPFKTEAEARAHLNQLAKAGVSAFTFTSEPGQKVTKLAAK